MALKPRYTLANKIAQKLLKDSKVDFPPVPVKELLNYLNINYLPYDFPEKKVSAVLMKDNDLIVVGVNKNHPTNRQRFSIAHEIGHYMLGHHVDSILDPAEVADGMFDTTCENAFQEQEANHFASELLMPSLAIKDDFKSTKDAKSLAKKYDISEQAMWIRLLKLKLI